MSQVWNGRHGRGFAHRQVVRRKPSLVELLKFWGVWDCNQTRRSRARGADRKLRRARRYVTTRRLSEGKLYDLLHSARAVYRGLITKVHPDRNGDHGTAAQINAAWERTEKLFARLGIKK